MCSTELKRYKDTLRLREQDIQKLKQENSLLKKNEANFKQ